MIVMMKVGMVGRMTRRLAGLLVLLLAGTVLAACGDGAGSRSEAADGRVRVTVPFYPLQFVAEQVGGDRVQVTNLTKPGAEPHDLELEPQALAEVTESDLMLYLSGFQPAVDDAVAAQSPHAFDVAEAADLTGDDPHFWLDPTRLAAVGDAVAEQLADVDPDGAEQYAAGAERLRGDLERLDGEMSAGLADCAVSELVTSHTAFRYLADRYGFEQVGIAGIAPDAEPSPQQVARVAETVRRTGVTTVYSEVLVDPAVAETVAAETGAQVAVLDPVEGITDSSAGRDYLAVMRANLATLQKGQGCS
jgi:zinc transport system substrate-binding protein